MKKLEKMLEGFSFNLDSHRKGYNLVVSALKSAAKSMSTDEIKDMLSSIQGELKSGSVDGLAPVDKK